MAYQRRLSVIVFGAALLSLCHVAMFPSVSLATGELSPRSTYFEENALIPIVRRATLSVQQADEQGSGALSLCGTFEELGLPCTVSGENQLVHTEARPAFVDSAQEAIVLVFILPDFDSLKDLARWLHSIQRAQWLSKTVVLLASGDYHTFLKITDTVPFSEIHLHRLSLFYFFRAQWEQTTARRSGLKGSFRQRQLHVQASFRRRLGRYVQVSLLTVVFGLDPSVVSWQNYELQGKEQNCQIWTW